MGSISGGTPPLGLTKPSPEKADRKTESTWLTVTRGDRLVGVSRSLPTETKGRAEVRSIIGSCQLFQIIYLIKFINENEMHQYICRIRKV